VAALEATADSLSLRPNDALLWAALRWSRVQGCAMFDMGGNNLFKSGFSRQTMPIYCHLRDQTFLRRVERTERLFLRARRMAKVAYARLAAIREARKAATA
jgi:hypothetical protein